MSARRILVICTLALVTVSGSLGQLSIDATGPIRVRKHEAVRGSGGGVGRKLPLQIAIETKVSAPDANGKTLVEFVLTNSGARDLTLPVSPNPGDVEPSNPKLQYTVMVLGLRISLSNKPGVIYEGGADLYGSLSLPASLVKLAPGDSIRILTRVALPGPGANAIIATASLDRETLRPVNGELISDSQEIGFSSSRQYTVDSLLRAHE